MSVPGLADPSAFNELRSLRAQRRRFMLRAVTSAYTERWSDDGPSIDFTGLLADVDRCIAKPCRTDGGGR